MQSSFDVVIPVSKMQLLLISRFKKQLEFWNNRVSYPLIMILWDLDLNESHQLKVVELLARCAISELLSRSRLETQALNPVTMEAVIVNASIYDYFDSWGVVTSLGWFLWKAQLVDRKLGWEDFKRRVVSDSRLREITVEVQDYDIVPNKSKINFENLLLDYADGKASFLKYNLLRPEIEFVDTFAKLITQWIESRKIQFKNLQTSQDSNSAKIEQLNEYCVIRVKDIYCIPPTAIAISKLSVSDLRKEVYNIFYDTFSIVTIHVKQSILVGDICEVKDKYGMIDIFVGFATVKDDDVKRCPISGFFIMNSPSPAEFEFFQAKVINVLQKKNIVL